MKDYTEATSWSIVMPAWRGLFNELLKVDALSQ
jgi:hypothetical protein